MEKTEESSTRHFPHQTWTRLKSRADGGWRMPFGNRNVTGILDSKKDERSRGEGGDFSFLLFSCSTSWYKYQKIIGVSESDIPSSWGTLGEKTMQLQVLVPLQRCASGYDFKPSMPLACSLRDSQDTKSYGGFKPFFKFRKLMKVRLELREGKKNISQFSLTSCGHRQPAFL